MGLEERLQIQQGKAQSTARWEEQPQAAVQAGGQTAGGPGRHQVEHELVMCPNRRLMVSWAALKSVLPADEGK